MKININKEIIILLISFVTLFYGRLSWSSENAFQFSLERMTYNEGSKSISLGIRNNETSPYLIQASMKWLDESSGLNLLDKKENTPFIITPLLKKIEPQEYYDWVIKFSGTKDELPTDRESVYIAQLRLIPATEENNPNVQITFIRALNFKIYYRPSKLNGLKIKDVESELTFSVVGNQLIAKNNSPIYLAFNTIKINGKEIELQELSKNVPPFGTQKYVLNNKHVDKVTWQLLDELLFPLDEKTINIK